MIAVGAALVPQAALAHARLLQTDPAPGAVLAAAPAAVTLVFSEQVTPAGAGIRIYSPSGRDVASSVTERGSVLVAALDTTDRGTYVVAWQVYAADTHPSRGAFQFTIGSPSPNPFLSLLDTPQAGTATPLGLGLQALGRFIHFVGFALVFGSIAYGALIGRRLRFGRLAGAGIALLVIAEPVALLGQLASLSFDGDTALAVLGSSFGRVLGLRLGAALLTWALVAIDRDWPVLAVGGAVALLDGVTAHAIPGAPGLGQLLVSVHVAAMGLWIGGIASFIAVPDRRFSRYAFITFGVAASSGMVLALAHTNLGTALVGTDYGAVLAAKVVAVAAALICVLLRRRRAELLVAVLVLAAAAVIAALPPPV